jgi:hypothetical protein
MKMVYEIFIEHIKVKPGKEWHCVAVVGKDKFDIKKKVFRNTRWQAVS